MKNYVFFDVDGTLINLTSMLSFFEYVENQTSLNNIQARLGKLIWRAAEACKEYLPREYLNACYYRNFQGREVAQINALGMKWFMELMTQQADVFKPEVVERLCQHQNQGHEVVLVSGSFEACLRPIANFLGVKHILCSILSEKNGVYDGRLLPPQTIGTGKALAIEYFLRQQGALPSACLAAYGDHYSDLPMLGMAKNRYVVTGDPELENHARAHHWNII